MIARQGDQEHFRCCPRASTVVLVVLTAVALSLQGCDRHFFGKRWSKLQKGELVPAPPTPLPPALQKAACDPIVKSKSDDFQNAVQKDAKAYYDGVVKTFSLEFVKYPFCLENNYFVVHALERKMRGIDQLKKLSSSSFEERLNRTITAQFSKHELTWQTMCQDWAERNKAHQLKNLPMVRKVLGFSGEDQLLKAQIEAFFSWEPWWFFFRDMAKSGCMRRYAQRCFSSAKVAHRHAKELVMQTMGDRQLTWHAFDLPTDSLLQVSEEGRHQVTLDGGTPFDLPKDSLLQVSEEGRNQVPIELKAGGQQIQSRHA